MQSENGNDSGLHPWPAQLLIHVEFVLHNVDFHLFECILCHFARLPVGNSPTSLLKVIWVEDTHWLPPSQFLTFRVDINGDGKADYVWTRKLDGHVKVWYNDYPKKPTWREGGEIAEGVDTSGANIKYAKLTTSGRADYVAIDPKEGSISAWPNGCSNPGLNLDLPEPSKNKIKCYNSGQKSSYGKIEAAAKSFCSNIRDDSAGPVFSNFHKEAKKTSTDGYHFAVAFEVFEGCKWEFSMNECLRYFHVPIDSCDCSKKGDKQEA